jgi:POT family proton-dependent oligopeptide transporter
MEATQGAGALTIEQIQDFKGKYPKQLWFLFLSEMWERFAFYGMRGMLTVFMVSKLNLSDRDANLQYGATQAFVYALAFIGGLFADKILGFRKSIFWGGLLMVAGSFTLAFSPHDFFYIGISITIVGTGFFKPNISTMVGQLYRAGDPRQDAGFGLFYTGINIGALLGGILCIHVANNYSWNAAFSLAGIGMLIGMGIFIFTKRTLGPIGLSPLGGKMPARKIRLYDIMVYAGSLLVIPLILLLVSKTDYTDKFMYTIGPAALVYIVYEILRLGNETERKKGGAIYMVILLIAIATGCLLFFNKAGLIATVANMGAANTAQFIDANFSILKYSFLGACLVYTFYGVFRYFNNVQQKIVAALVFIIVSIFFWAFFEQAGGSLSLFALYNVKHEMFGLNINPNEVNNSSNSVFVILFSFIVGLLWLWLSKRKLEPNTVVKFGLGFLFVSLAFYIFYYTRFFADAKGMTSLSMFTLAYLVITFGELCLSPISMSIMTKLSPQRLHGVMMGLLFLASAYGQYAAGIFGADMSSTVPNASLHDKLMAFTEGYKGLSVYALIIGIALIIASPLLRKLMHEVH